MPISIAQCQIQQEAQTEAYLQCLLNAPWLFRQELAFHLAIPWEEQLVALQLRQELWMAQIEFHDEYLPLALRKSGQP
jgi:hypothetical protein